MKRLCCGLFFLAASIANAATIEGTESYLGKIDSLSVGFYDQIGISLPNGSTCRNNRIVVLQKSNPDFEQIYSLLLAAVAAKFDVHMYRVAAKYETYGTIDYCIITEAALGRFSIWPVDS